MIAEGWSGDNVKNLGRTTDRKRWRASGKLKKVKLQQRVQNSSEMKGEQVFKQEKAEPKKLRIDQRTVGSRRPFAALTSRKICCTSSLCRAASSELRHRQATLRRARKGQWRRLLLLQLPLLLQTLLLRWCFLALRALECPLHPRPYLMAGPKQSMTAKS